MGKETKNTFINAQSIIDRAKKETQDKVSAALALLDNPPQTPEQLLLFENLQEYNLNLKTEAKKKKQKTEKGLTMEQEVAAQLLALNFGFTEIYILTHPGCKTDNAGSLWARGSKFCNAKVRLRAKQLKEAAAVQALMPVTEAYAGLSELARKSAKDEVRRSSYRDILDAHGVFDKHKDKEMPDTFIFKVILPDGTEYKPAGKAAKAQ